MPASAPTGTVIASNGTAAAVVASLPCQGLPKHVLEEAANLGSGQSVGLADALELGGLEQGTAVDPALANIGVLDENLCGWGG